MNLEDFKRFLIEKGNQRKNAAEIQNIISWLHSSQSLDEIEEGLKKDSNGEAIDEDFELIYEKILDEIRISDASMYPPKELSVNFNGPVRKGRSRTLLAVAASLAILMISAYFLFVSKYSDPQIEKIAEFNQPVIKQALMGEKLNVQLSDGTRIKLNGGSSVVYHPHTYVNDRLVELEGEAYFEVAHNDKLPFKIKVKEGIEVKVLGTSFIVNTLNPEEKIVAVKSGKVSVKNTNKDQSIVLSKDEFVKMSEYQTLDKQVISNSDIYFGWIENELVMEDATFYQVLRKLNQWYGYEIEVSLDYADFDKYSGSLTNPTLKEVMESLSHSYKFNYTIDDKRKQIRIK